MINKTTKIILIVLLMGFGLNTIAQVAINNDGSNPDASAMLEIKSTDKGLLPPRMTDVEMNAITTPAEGLIIYCTNCTPKAPYFFNGTYWINMINGLTAIVPDAPTIGTATAGNTQATVSFTAPASNGGSTITSYTATSNPGGLTGTLTQAGSGTITITGLTNGVTYVFSVTATNATGTSAASAASNAVTPATTPDAPTIGTATAGNTQATISFTAPANDGGSPITSYTATSDPDNITCTLTQAGSGIITVTGLTNGTAYTFTVIATNAVGTGATSAVSNSITPTVTVPDAPTIGTATAGNTQATVSFTAPANDGGSTITSYTATSNTGNVTATLTQAGSGIILVTGLTNGTAYTFTVTATNNIGTSVASVASNLVTPGLFTCGNALIDSRDNKSYTTVKIGTQCWMAENLNVGISIDFYYDQQPNGIIEKYCIYDGAINCDISGGLYQWNEMMQYTTTQGGQGICPDGWHLPTDDEWKTMEMALGMSQDEANQTGYRGTDEGEQMKSTRGWLDNGNGTNSSGFNGLPVGERVSNVSYGNFGYGGHWWSSSECSGSHAWHRDLSYSNDLVLRSDEYKTFGYSVRCLKD